MYVCSYACIYVFMNAYNYIQYIYIYIIHKPIALTIVQGTVTRSSFTIS